MCYRRVCGSTPGDWDANNPVLALSLRRCRTTAHTSSAAPRFPTMLLSPRPFGSRLGGRLGVINPELRPPLVAIPSVRDTAHAFTAHGSREKERLWEVSIAATPRYSPWAACAFVDDLCTASRPSPSGPSPCTRLSRAPTPMPHLTACRASDFRRSFLMPTLHRPSHPFQALPCS